MFLLLSLCFLCILFLYPSFYSSLLCLSALPIFASFLFSLSACFCLLCLSFPACCAFRLLCFLLLCLSFFLPAVFLPAVSSFSSRLNSLCDYNLYDLCNILFVIMFKINCWMNTLFRLYYC